MNSREVLQYLLRIKSHTVGVYPADRVPLLWAKPCAFVLNTQNYNQHGAHWVAIYVDKYGTGTYFDSLGKPPQIPEHLRRMQKNCKKFRWNNKRLQSDYSNVCGHYCIMFLYYMSTGSGLTSFLKIFSQNLQKNDTLARNFVEEVCKV